MPADPLYQALHPFHQWAQIAALCAFILAATSFVLLGVSRRLTRRWWVGMGMLALCLLVVAFGARSRGASYDLYPYAICFAYPAPYGCAAEAALMHASQQRVETLGNAVLTVTVFGAVITVIALIIWPLDADWRSGLKRVWFLPVAIFVAGFGAFLTANGVAQWIQYAYLADITKAGDGLGQLPLIEAIMGAIFGVVVLLIGLALVIISTQPRRAPAAAAVALLDG
ncbi:MAG TPA: hypothetical protein VF739_16810 [Ktedonobacterales bacterium]|nr:hypothetical protein [Ktedonobacterales bacterium]